MNNEYDYDAPTSMQQIADSITNTEQHWINEAREREYIRLDARTMVLATIDELNQYLLGNVTLEAATDAARELTHKLNASW